MNTNFTLCLNVDNSIFINSAIWLPGTGCGDDQPSINDKKIDRDNEKMVSVAVLLTVWWPDGVCTVTGG
ncbi:hypothetical protein DF182_26965 [Chitinophaga flava]|uniref:Uncharacterized protein n=1 Tax=Chitinophaga flava TaxID=2259036 RepID=A0A365XVS8_9BACT|nr:hypothetical protein DF182_26965 [Chitinophaga flava]